MATPCPPGVVNRGRRDKDVSISLTCHGRFSKGSFFLALVFHWDAKNKRKRRRRMINLKQMKGYDYVRHRKRNYEKWSGDEVKKQK